MKKEYLIPEVQLLQFEPEMKIMSPSDEFADPGDGTPGTPGSGGGMAPGRKIYI